MKPSEALRNGLKLNIPQGYGRLFGKLPDTSRETFCACAVGQMVLGTGAVGVDLGDGVVVGARGGTRVTPGGEVPAMYAAAAWGGLDLRTHLPDGHPLRVLWGQAGDTCLNTLIYHANDVMRLPLEQIADTLESHGF